MPGSDVLTTDVLIIGGGLTGLTAAAELHRAKVKFALLEAHPERLGGRVKTSARPASGPGSKDYHFDHGAQYIGQTQSEIWRLAQEHLPHAVIDGYAARKPWPDQVTVLNGRRYVNDGDSWLFGIGGIPPEMSLWTVLAVLLLIQEIEAIEQAVNVAEPWTSAPEILPLDLASLSAVRDFTKTLAGRIDAGEVPRVAAIVCNAFYWNLLEGSAELTPDGYDKTVQVNHIGHAALVLGLLNHFDAAAAAAGGRVVVLSTAAHETGKAPWEKTPPGIDGGDLDRMGVGGQHNGGRGMPPSS